MRAACSLDMRVAAVAGRSNEFEEFIECVGRHRAETSAPGLPDELSTLWYRRAGDFFTDADTNSSSSPIAALRNREGDMPTELLVPDVMLDILLCTLSLCPLSLAGGGGCATIGSARDALNGDARPTSRPPPVAVAAAAPRARSVTSERFSASLARNARSSEVRRTEERWSNETRLLFLFEGDKDGSSEDGSSADTFAIGEVPFAWRRNRAPRRESRQPDMSPGEGNTADDTVGDTLPITSSPLSCTNNSRRLFSFFVGSGSSFSSCVFS